MCTVLRNNNLIKMKIIYILFCFITSQIACLGQNNASSYPFLKNVNVTYSEATLPIYQIDSCLFPVLDTMIEKDKNCHYYSESKTCYQFAMYYMRGNYQIIIRTNYIDLIDRDEYLGVFMRQGRIFFIRGNTNKFIYKKK